MTYFLPEHMSHTCIVHWPISNYFSKMANQNFSIVHLLCTHGPSITWRTGKMADHFNFLFCTLYVCMVMPPYVSNSALCAWFGIWQLFCLSNITLRIRSFVKVPCCTFPFYSFSGSEVPFTWWMSSASKLSMARKHCKGKKYLMLSYWTCATQPCKL